MAIIKQCDKCKTLNDVGALITITRRRECRNQHDGTYFSAVQADYDLCEKCAREIEMLFISAEKADEIIMT